ncbi:MAG TPA: hypothetical protein VGB54_11385 [Allosphingosinicella sp.]|jgi:hypothetical protein
MWKSICAAILFVGLAGCSAGADLSAAEEEVERFHDLYRDGRFADIYRGVSRELADTISEADWLAMMSQTSGAMGEFRDSERTRWKVNYGDAGSLIELNYDSRFANGRASERFKYVDKGDGPPELIAYSILPDDGRSARDGEEEAKNEGGSREERDSR